MLRLAFRTLVEPTLQHYNIPYTETMLQLSAPLSVCSAAAALTEHTVQASGKCKRRDTEAAHRVPHEEYEVEQQQHKQHKQHEDENDDDDDDDKHARKGALAGGYRDWSQNLLDAHQRLVRHERMRLIIILLSCTSATFYITAAFLSHFTAVALALIVCGELICTTACAATQVGYGMIVHARWSNYTFFMPFRGGRDFLRWQLAGWWCYCSTFLVTLAAALESEEMSPWVLLLAALLSVLSQACIFKSILLFDPHPRSHSFLEQNGEGVMALCAFSGAFLFTYVYQILDAFFFGSPTRSASSRTATTTMITSSSSSSSSGGGGRGGVMGGGEKSATTAGWWSLSWLLQHHGNTRRTRLPFVVVMLSIALAVPCVFIALGRTTHEWRRVAKLTARREEQREQHRHEQRRRRAKERRSARHVDPHSRSALAPPHTDSTATDSDDVYSYHSTNDSSDGVSEEVTTRSAVGGEGVLSTPTPPLVTDTRAGAGAGEAAAAGHAGCPPREITNHLATVWATGIANTLEVTLILCGTFAPLTLMAIVYYLTQSFTPSVLTWVQRVLPGLCSAMMGILLLSFMAYHARVGGVPRVVTELRVMVVTYCIYGMSILTALAYFTPVLLWPRVSTAYMPLSLGLLSIFGSYFQVRMAVRVGVYAVIGYVSYRQCERYRWDGWRGVVAPASVLPYLADVALVSFWLLYLPRYQGKPYYTGAQRSPRFIRWARKYIFADMARYFRFRLILDDPAAVHLRSGGDRRFIFSFHPHGVFAGTALVCTQTREWAEKMGHAEHRHITTHVATIVLNIPVLRDFNLSLGALSVSRPCIESSLQQGNSVLIVTGGQAEMIHTRRSDTQMTLITQHVGFVRLAIANRVPLVPLLSMAENNVMGLLQVPAIQRLTLHLLGFPLPVIPYGRFFLPLPYRTPLVMVVGKPVEIPADADANNPEHVARLAETYFSELKALFYRHRAEAGYPNMELVLRNDAAHKPARVREAHQTVEEKSIEKEEKLLQAGKAATS